MGGGCCYLADCSEQARVTIVNICKVAQVIAQSREDALSVVQGPALMTMAPRFVLASNFPGEGEGDGEGGLEVREGDDSSDADEEGEGVVRVEGSLRLLGSAHLSVV